MKFSRKAQDGKRQHTHFDGTDRTFTIEQGKMTRRIVIVHLLFRFSHGLERGINCGVRIRRRNVERLDLDESPQQRSRSPNPAI